MTQWAKAEAHLTRIPNAPREAVIFFATSDAVVSQAGAEPVMLDMAGADLSLLNTGRAPLLVDHHRHHSGVIGGILRAWIEGERALAHVRFARTQAGEDALSLIRDGFGRSASVGFSYGPEDLEPSGTNGVHILRRWRPFEISLVAVPASWSAMVLPQNEGAEALARHRATQAAAGAHRHHAMARTAAGDFAQHAAPGLAMRLGLPDAEAVRVALLAEAASFRV